ncbi:MAG TPA: dTDP-4-dehydrorhamnose 3,5-epimerase [Candidatus Binatia bacterium]|nr:dTDP-4-dehydrorhamnose 3,5-epimerase [Candidatus Binatia bacterium]
MTAPAPQFQALPTNLPGLVLLQPPIFEDARGIFVKTFHDNFFRDAGIPFEPREEFYSVSAKDVLRGMHFQLPPTAHAKLVYCLSGRVMDVVLDMRRGSPTYGRSFNCILDAIKRESLYVPVGFAHGFLSLEDRSLMIYKTDAVHDPACDTGIAWDSFGFEWPVTNPIMSDRDRRFVRWREFNSPF